MLYPCVMPLPKKWKSPTFWCTAPFGGGYGFMRPSNHSQYFVQLMYFLVCNFKSVQFSVDYHFKSSPSRVLTSKPDKNFPLLTRSQKKVLGFFCNDWFVFSLRLYVFKENNKWTKSKNRTSLKAFDYKLSTKSALNRESKTHKCL